MKISRAYKLSYTDKYIAIYLLQFVYIFLRQFPHYTTAQMDERLQSGFFMEHAHQQPCSIHYHIVYINHCHWMRVRKN